MQNNPETCGGTHDARDLPVVSRTSAAITDATTVAELKALPMADIIAHFAPNPVTTIAREYGPKGNIFFRAMRFDGVGSKVDGHAHNYDHVTYLSRGRLNVLAWPVDPATGKRVGDPIERQYAAPAAILIKKGMAHELTSLDADTRADCIYAIRDAGTGDVSDEWDGSLEPYV